MRHLDREKSETDGKIDQMHVRFAQEIEELDLRIVRDRKEFRRYVDTVRHSEEFADLQRAVKKIHEQIDARMMDS
jgi:predicted nuclease with TOPRIM domain